MLDDVFGETPAASEAPKQPATKPAKPRMTPAQKFKSDTGRKAPQDSKGKGFKIATSPTDDGSFVLEVVDEDGIATTIGRPLTWPWIFTRGSRLPRLYQWLISPDQHSRQPPKFKGNRTDKRRRYCIRLPNRT